MFTVKYKNKEYQFEDKITLKQLAKDFNLKCYIATVNNRLRELDYYVNYNCEVDFFDLRDFDAVRVYETSFRYLLIMAIERLYPKSKVHFHEGVSRSLSCTIEDDNIRIDEKFLKKLTDEIDALVAADLPIRRSKMTKADAIKMYEEKGYLDKIEILKYRQEEDVNVYQCEDYFNYMFGYMVPSTGYLNNINFVYAPGFIIQLPKLKKMGIFPI